MGEETCLCLGLSQPLHPRTQNDKLQLTCTKAANRSLTEPEGCPAAVLFSAFPAWLGGSLIPAQQYSLWRFLSSCYRHWDSLTDCNTISAWLFCLTDVKAPDASKYVLLRQIRQSSVCLWAWFLKCVSSQRQKYRGKKKQMEACHITERAVWFPTFLVRQKSEMSRRSCKLLLWFDRAKNSKTETLAWKL